MKADSKSPLVFSIVAECYCSAPNTRRISKTFPLFNTNNSIRIMKWLDYGHSTSTMTIRIAYIALYYRYHSSESLRDVTESSWTAINTKLSLRHNGVYLRSRVLFSYKSDNSNVKNTHKVSLADDYSHAKITPRRKHERRGSVPKKIGAKIRIARELGNAWWPKRSVCNVGLRHHQPIDGRRMVDLSVFPHQKVNDGYVKSRLFLF